MKRLGRFPFSPRRSLALLLAFLSPLWLFSGEPGGLAIAAGALVAALLATILDAALTPSALDVELERVLPATAGIGETASGSYELKSDWPRSIRGWLYDELPRSFMQSESGPYRFHVPVNGGASIPVAFTPLERGVHELGRVVLRVHGPLGLVRRSLRYVPGDALRVTPSLEGVRHYRLLALQHRLRDAGMRAIRRRGQGTTFSHLREYVRGDDPRHIDWKATARRTRVISREFTVEQGQTIMVVIDAGRMMTQLSGPLSRFEYALSASLVLADVAVHSRDQIGLMVFDDQIRAFIPPARGGSALEDMRSALVGAQATLVEPDYAMAFRTLATRHRKRSLIVLFTDVIDSRSSQAIIAHTTRSAARHLPLVVALRNDHLMEASHPTDVASTAALYEHAAAEELVSAREEALVRMRRAGVSVLDVSPNQATAALINRYIELKARSSL